MGRLPSRLIVADVTIRPISGRSGRVRADPHGSQYRCVWHWGFRPRRRNTETHRMSAFSPAARGALGEELTPMIQTSGTGTLGKRSRLPLIAAIVAGALLIVGIRYG